MVGNKIADFSPARHAPGRVRRSAVDQSTASLAAATWSRSGFAMSSSDRRSGLGRSSFSRRPVILSNSRSRAARELTSSLGSNGVAARSTTMSSRAGSITRHMSTRQYARGLRSEEYGAHSLRCTKASMIYKATEDTAPSRSCATTLKSRTPFDISVSMSGTPCSWRSERKSDVDRLSDAARMAD